MKAIMYGAGNIGRGFIGQTLALSGYEVGFVDVNESVISYLNERRSYPVNVLLGEESREEIVENVYGIDGRDEGAVASAIAEADIMATAVGVNVLKFIAKPIAGGLRERWKRGNNTPFNIIICENLIGADAFLKGLIANELCDEEKEKLDTLIGFVEASIGRMVPVQTPEMQGDNPLRVCVEAYNKLPLDSAAVKGELPPIKNAVWHTPFEYYIERKLYIHNMGHAMCAYLGSICGYEYIWQAIENPYIHLLVSKAMTQSALALSKKHGVAPDEIYDHVLDLLGRFGNRQLGDTVKRVGNDIKRKLSKGDRLIGAYDMCKAEDLSCDYIKVGIAAALTFPGQDTGMEIEDLLKNVSELTENEISEIMSISKELSEKGIENFKVKFTKELKA